MPPTHLAAFTSDVTPPAGHPLCGGWIEPVRGADDPLEAPGVVLLGRGQPVVLVAVDWCGLRNDAHLAWRQALAKAAHTVPERVAVHCVHPHNAPFADTGAEALIRAAPRPVSSLDLTFFEGAVARSADALRAALARTTPVTHYGAGQARVREVASNRRVLGADGKVKYTRTSATRDPVARAEPEGVIDPFLKTVSFWNGERALAALHFYATHPMSYYGDGRVSADFCGLARRKRRDEDPRVHQMYFTGCAGNVTAGKYNDGSRENRAVLRDRIHAGMKAAWAATARQPLGEWSWRAEPLRLAGRVEKSFGEEESLRVLNDPAGKPAPRNNAAFQVAWRRRLDRPIDLAALDLGGAAVVFLPGEPFVEYQLEAQRRGAERFVAVAGYGDGGPGYLPTDRAYLEGGYEPTVALAAPCEELLTRGVARLLGAET